MQMLKLGNLSVSIQNTFIPASSLPSYFSSTRSVPYFGGLTAASQTISPCSPLYKWSLNSNDCIWGSPNCHSYLYLSPKSRESYFPLLSALTFSYLRLCLHCIGNWEAKNDPAS